MILIDLSGLFDLFFPFSARLAKASSLRAQNPEAESRLFFASPESPTPKPVAPDRSSLMRNFCFSSP